VTTVVYTDGACSGNPGPGGWAWAVPGGRYASGCEAQSTNQRMEIAAALDAVRQLDGPLDVVSDSTYVVNCFRDRWWEGWIKRGWLNSQKKPVANRDLWEPFIELVRERGDVEFRWVKGHSGDPMNDLVDRLAVEAATSQQGRIGVGEPAQLGPADDVSWSARRRVAEDMAEELAELPELELDLSGPAEGVSGPALARAALRRDGAEVESPHARPGVEGHSLVVLGHRPTELGGYDDNPLTDAVRDRLADVVGAKAEMHDDLVVVSGLRLGAEMLGAEVAVELGVPLVAVLPYPDPDSVWPSASRARFRDLVDHARDVVLLQKKAPESKQKAGAALARRDAWLARNVDEAVLVWDGQDAALGKLFRSLEDRLGDDVWVIDPAELV
jgi:ribonuclease HI